MTCPTCPTKIRCFLHLRNCDQQTRCTASGSGSVGRSSTDATRLDVGRVAEDLQARDFNMITMQPMRSQADRVVEKNRKFAEAYGRGPGPIPPAPPRPPVRPYKSDRKPAPRTEVVHTHETRYANDDSLTNVLLMQAMLNSLDTQHNPGHTEWTAPSPAPEVSTAQAWQEPAPAYEPPAPAPSYSYEPPTYSPSPAPSYSYEPPSYDSSSSYDSGSSYSSSDSSSSSSWD